MDKQEKWDKRFLDHAHTVADWSRDPSTKVGAIIVDGDHNIRAAGFNGFARGIDDTDERLSDRDIKYMLMTHAEANAIATSARMGVKIEGCTIYSTLFPCTSCCGLIIQSGIKRVVTTKPSDELLERWGDQFKISKMMFIEAGIELNISDNIDE